MYRMHILYICIFTRAHAHTSFHGHDFELRNISRHLQGKKRVKIVCFSRLVSVASDLFHCRRRDTPSSGLMCLWPCRRRAPRSRGKILVRFLHLPKSLIDTLLLNVLGKMMKGFFWVTKWLTNAVKSGFQATWRGKVALAHVLNDTTIYWIYPLRMPVTTRFGNP